MYKKTFSLVCVDPGQHFGLTAAIILNPKRDKKPNCKVSLLDKIPSVKVGDKFSVTIERVEA